MLGRPGDRQEPVPPDQNAVRPWGGEERTGAECQHCGSLGRRGAPFRAQTFIQCPFHHHQVPKARPLLTSATPQSQARSVAKGSGGLVVFDNFAPTLLSLPRSNPYLQSSSSLCVNRLAPYWLPTLAHFLSKLLEEGIHKNKAVNQERGGGADSGSNTREGEKNSQGEGEAEPGDSAPQERQGAACRWYV